MFMDGVSLGQISIVLMLLAHVLIAIVASVILSTIPRKNYPYKFIITFLVWVTPFLGALLLIKNGKYVPGYDGDSYQTIVRQVANKHASELREQEQDKFNRYRDSGYGGTTGGDGSDGGGGDG